jgi:hypothetical protein
MGGRREEIRESYGRGSTDQSKVYSQRDTSRNPFAH